jgi:hypothetical protein
MDVNEKQCQIDDKLYFEIYEYISKNKITLEGFSKLIRLDFYILNKAVDRQIRMNIFTTVIEKIKNTINQ